MNAGFARLFVKTLRPPPGVVLATGAVSTVLGQPGIAGLTTGALPARLNQPAGIAVIGPGRLAIVDQAENAVLALR